MFILICHTKVSKLGTWLGKGEKKKSGKWIRKAEISKRKRNGSVVNLHDLAMTSESG
jgi:hypothetical protein